VADGENILHAQQNNTSINRGFGYRGIIGASGVLTAQYAATETRVELAGGTGANEPSYIQFYGSASPSLTTLPQTGFTRVALDAINQNFTYRANKTYRLDYNHIWENHNIDVGVQMLESMVDRSAFGGSSGLVFYMLGRNHEGDYLVWNSVDQGGPLYTGDGVSSTAYPLYQNNLDAHRNYFYNNYFVASLQDYRLHGGSGSTMVKNTTTAFYLNDSWTLNDNWAINLGLRVSNSKLDDAVGERVNATGIEPRFRIQYDLFGDNQHVFAFSATQKGGIITTANVGGSYSVSGDAQRRIYLWNQDNPNPGQSNWAPYFVNYADVKDVGKYGYYWSYTDSAINWSVDKDIKPQQTTEFELNYRRAFGMGGYFRIALVYNFLSNALTSFALDEEVEVKDPTGAVPSNGLSTWAYKRYLTNDSSRGRHYASAELEWMRPLINEASYRLNWFGNWTIAKTTGNSLFSAAGLTAASESESHRFWEQALNVGIPAELMDPWGELNSPRHSIRTWFTYTHGERGGVNNTVTLLATYTTGSPGTFEIAYNLPANTFEHSTVSGGRITNFPSNIPLYPYGRGFRVGSSSYQFTLQYNLTVPVTKRVSVFAEISVIDPFNSIQYGDATSGFASRTTNNWQPDGSSMRDDMWGKRFAVSAPRNSTVGQTLGIPTVNNGRRRFDFKADAGFRF